MTGETSSWLCLLKFLPCSSSATLEMKPLTHGLWGIFQTQTIASNLGKLNWKSYIWSKAWREWSSKFGTISHCWSPKVGKCLVGFMNRRLL
jgi:hypothetical protein